MEPAPELGGGASASAAPAAAPRGAADLGWQVAGVLLVMSAAIQILRALAGLEAADQAPGGMGAAQAATTAATAQLVIGVFAAAIAGVAAFGLWRGLAWARWLVLGWVTLGAVIVILSAVSLGPRHLPPGYDMALIVVAVLVPIGWHVLLQRPSTVVTTVVGAAVVVATNVGIGVILASFRP